MRPTYIIAAAIGIFIILLLVSPHFISGAHAVVPATATSTPTQLLGMQTTQGSWQPEIANLRERLQVLGLPALNMEGSTLHIHQHLDMFIHGTSTPVSAGIGISE